MEQASGQTNDNMYCTVYSVLFSIACLTVS